MPRYALSFYSDRLGVISKVLEANSKDEAMKTFFDLFIADYSKDLEGFAWFKEDFEDPDKPLGAVQEI